MNSSDSSGSVLSQSASLPGRFSRSPIGVLRRTWLAAARLASRAFAAWITRAAIASPTLLFLSRKFSSAGPDHRLDLRLDLRVVEPALGLPLELRLVDADREDRGEPLADVLALDLHPLLDQVVRFHEPQHGGPDGREHPQLVGAAVAGGDRVDERPDVLVGGLGPGQGQVAAEAALLVLAIQDEGQGGDPLIVRAGR